MSNLTDDLKRSIDEMSYEDMFRLWRFAPVGDPRFTGEAGQYFKNVFADKRKQLEAGEHSRISKKIGWD